MATEPTILVKKADGSFVRMPLSEVKKLKAAQGGAKTTPNQITKSEPVKPQSTDRVLPTQVNNQQNKGMPAKPTAPAKPNLPPPTKLAPHSDNADFTKIRMPFSTPAPKNISDNKVNQVAVPSAAKPAALTPGGEMKKAKITSAVKPDDFSDPFEALPAGVDKNASATSVNRDDEVGTVLKKLSFPIPEAINARLNSAVTLLLKDIRTVEQTKELALKPVNTGGLGLTPTQAEELLRACESAMQPAPSAKNIEETKFQKMPTPLSVSPNMPLVPAPNIPEPMPAAPVAQPASFAMNGATGAKPVMRDVMPPMQAEVGPVDEIRLFSLVDFRRLSQNPTEAAARLGQKFINLKAESILLYFQGLAAWRESPLFKDYLSVVIGALNKRTKLSPVAASNPSGIQIPEIDAIIKMEKGFSI